jgi:NADH-quinone oxidoreductase subunit C
MNQRYQALAASVSARFGDTLQQLESTCGELTYEVDKDALLDTCLALRDEPDFGFEMLIDLCGVDYLLYGESEWQTKSASNSGFSRGVDREVVIPDPHTEYEPWRFAVVYHLLSIKHNHRVRLRVYTGVNNPPVLPSVNDIWSSANWYEREAFDLFGILFEGHPDLRRILTDYGFIGHPFRKDFPLSGNVEVKYDEEQGRVVYQPVSIEPRTLVPKTIRDDNRYTPEIRHFEGKDKGNDTDKDADKGTGGDV